ncbi:MAG: helix-turn-helix transcriptional regulator [Planctomycetota bacterium]|jgi:AraC-like DNA-binding protein
MNNLHDDIRGNTAFNRLEIGEILFAEYTCPLDTKMFGIWTEQDYLVHVVSGRKTWHTPDGSWTVGDGESIFFKKGAAVVEQHFESDFCVMIFFIPDSVTREVVTTHLAELGPCPPPRTGGAGAIPVANDVGLGAFFDSMRTYFSGAGKPTEPLLRLKLHELILGILTSRANPALATYLRAVADGEGPSLPAIMEANFRYHLSLEEFARLCHRSLSSFKREFRRHFDESPGRWLLQRRLDHAAALLRGAGERPVTEIALDSGFEDISHFNTAFRNRFSCTPTAYRAGEAPPSGLPGQ